MTTRLIAIAITGLVLMGYAPRWLSNSSGAWIIWVAAAAIVYGGPSLMRRATRTALSRMRSAPTRVTRQSAT